MTETYNNASFWEEYKNYLKEVRYKHLDAIHSLINRNDTIELLDLGCGMCNEALHLLEPRYYYYGVDVVHNPNVWCRQFDYRKDLENIKKDIKFSPTMFSSFFSAEITGTPQENYALYEKVFNTFPSIQHGLVSGFFYKNKKEQNIVEEVGGLKSYQTIENQIDFISNIFEEKRLITHTPSKMFGEDVYEVWKLFTRK